MREIYHCAFHFLQCSKEIANFADTQDSVQLHPEVVTEEDRVHR